MFISKIVVLNFRSIHLIRNELSSGQNIDELAELDPADYTDAIRFVLDPSWAAELRDTLSTARPGYVHIWLELHETDARPTILINKADDVRSFDVIRFINKANGTCDVSLEGIDSEPHLYIDAFHMLLYGNEPVLSSKIDLVTMGQEMRNQLFRYSNEAVQKYVQVWQNRFYGADYWRKIMRREEESLDLCVQNALEVRALQVEMARRKKPDLEARLDQHQAELRTLPADPNTAAHLTRLRFKTHHLKWKLKKRKVFFEALMNFELVRCDLFQITIERTIEKTVAAPEVQSPEELTEKLNCILGTLDRLTVEYMDGLTVRLIRKREENRLKLLVLQLKCAALNERPVSLMRSIEDLREVRDRYMENVNDAERTVELHTHSVDESRNAMKMYLDNNTKLTERLAACYAVRTGLDKSRFHCNAKTNNSRIEHFSKLYIDPFHENLLKVFNYQTLAAAQTINLIVSDIRADPQILNEFVGFVIDFVSFEEGHDELAARAQHALSHVLLNAIFQTKSCVERVRKIMCGSKHISFGVAKIWAMDIYRPNETIGLDLTQGFRLLTSFLRPIGCELVRDLLDDFVVMDTDAYSISEAVHMFKRNVICARSGHWQRADIEGNRMYGMSADGVAVFDAWPSKTEDRRQMIRSAEKLAQEWKQICEDRDRVTNQIVELEQIIRNKSSLMMQKMYEILDHQHRLFITKQMLARYQAQVDVTLNSIDSYQVILDGKFDMDTHQINQEISHRKQSIDEYHSIEESETRLSNLNVKIDKCFEDFHRMLRQTVMAQPPCEPSEWLKEMMDLVIATKDKLIVDWKDIVDSMTGDSSTDDLDASRLAFKELRDQLNRRKLLHDEVAQIERYLKKLHKEEKALGGLYDLEELAEFSDQQIKTNLSEATSKCVLSHEELLKRQSRFGQVSTFIGTQHKCISAAVQITQATIALQNNNHLKQLQEMIDAMNELLPMVHSSPVGSTLVENSIKLFLIYDERSVSQSALNPSITLQPHRISSLEFAPDVHPDSPQPFGRYEERCIALLWYLAGCTIASNQMPIILMNELIQMFPNEQRSHIVAMLTYHGVLNRRQAIVVAK